MPNRKKILELEEAHRAERTARFARSRRLLRYLPRRSNLDRYPVVRWFADAAKARPYLWSFRTPSVRRAFYVGSVLSLLPIYGLQLIIGFWAALVFRANLPLTLALQFITNPFTAAPFYYLTYRVGMWLVTTFAVGEGHPTLGTRFNALILGGVVVGLLVGLLFDLLLRFALWEAEVLRRRHGRAKRAAEAVRAAEPGASVTGKGSTFGAGLDPAGSDGVPPSAKVTPSPPEDDDGNE